MIHLRRFLAYMLISLGALSLGLVGTGPAIAQKAAASHDWSKTVVVTPEGGYRMGNPNAKLKLVEYGSRTCPICKQADVDSRVPLLAHIRSGRVSFEFRDFPVHGPIDLAPILIGRCVAPSRYFALLHAMFDMQEEAMTRFRAIPQATLKTLGTDPVKTADLLGNRMGYVALAGKFGVTPAKAKACLTSKAGLDGLERRTKAAAAAGVNSTPRFVLNGQPLSASRWDGVEAVIALYDKGQ